MKCTIKLPEAVARDLSVLARVRGVSPDEVAAELLAEATNKAIAQLAAASKRAKPEPVGG